MQSNAELSTLFPAAAPEAWRANPAREPAPGGEAAGALLPPRRRRRWPWLAGAAVLAAAVGGVVLWRAVAQAARRPAWRPRGSTAAASPCRSPPAARCRR